jgi:hypothetical protein
MFASQPPAMPCLECGASVPQAELRTHVCDWHEWLDHQVLSHRDELGRFEHELGAYLATAPGRFALWCAQRDRGDLGETR